MPGAFGIIYGCCRRKRRLILLLVAFLVGFGLIYYDARYWWQANNGTTTTDDSPTTVAASDDVPTARSRSNGEDSKISSINVNNNLQPQPQVHSHPPKVVIDIISIGSQTRPEYQQAQKRTFGKHPSIRYFFAITELDDRDEECTSTLSWRDVQNISGFCGGKRRDIQHKHRFLYELRVKFAKVQWLQRTKSNPIAWLCAQKRPIQGLWKAVTTKYRKSNNNNNNNNHSLNGQELLPDFLIVMDDDTYYDMEKVTDGLLDIQKQQSDLHNGDDSMVLAGCAIRSRLQNYQWKWSFPFGGWGTIFSKRALQALLHPLQCNNYRNDAMFTKTTTTTTTTTLTDSSPQQQSSTTAATATAAVMNERFCPKLFKDRIGEYQVYQDGMSLVDIMYQYVMKEPYVDHAKWRLGFCLHSDWVWGYMVNYYNVSVAMGRRSKDLVVDRLGAYNGSEINPPYSDALLRLRRQCDYDSDQNCTREAHMCHYITPQHMHYLSSTSSQQQDQQQEMPQG